MFPRFQFLTLRRASFTGMAEGGVTDESAWRHLLVVVAQAAYGSRISLRAFWVFQAVFWAVSAVALAILVRHYHQVEYLPWIMTGRIAMGVLLTALLRQLYRQRFTQRLESGRKLLWILALNVVAALAGAGFWLVLFDFVLPELPEAAPFTTFTMARLYSLFTWNVAYFGLELVLDFHSAKLAATEAGGRASAAELKQLQTQLNPHFLFNSLNTIVASLEPGHPTREIVRNLADYLRFSLHEARPLEPLGRELDALESYVGLQQIRFQDGLQCRIEASPAAMRVMVPPMLVQPLFENAFKYGPLSSTLPLHVRLMAQVVDGWLEIEVFNSGRWVTPADRDSFGSGLNNLRRRLQLLLGENATLVIEPGHDFVRVVIRIPLNPQRPVT